LKKYTVPEILEQLELLKKTDIIGKDIVEIIAYDLNRIEDIMNGHNKDSKVRIELVTRALD
jgi:hypothetical protein